MMDLAQRNINFGQITKYDYRTKSLVINNLSEVPLIYRIKKSGSIASLDLNISNVDKSGVIRYFIQAICLAFIFSSFDFFIFSFFYFVGCHCILSKIRPYKKREVQFIFKPTFAGPFYEKLVIENLYHILLTPSPHSSLPLFWL